MRCVSRLILLFLMLTSPFAAQAQDKRPSQPITADNVTHLTRLDILGRGWINQIAWSPDGAVLAVATSAGVWLHDAHDVDAAPRFLETQSDTWSVAFSQDSRLLAAGGRDMSVSVWTLNAGSVPAPLYDLECRVGEWWKPVESVAFNPDGTMLACASDGVMLWDMGTGDHLVTIGGEPDFWGDTHVAFSPDGTTLATTGTSGKTQAAAQQAGRVRLWDVHTYAMLASWQLPAAQGTGHYVAYSPDGTLLAVAGQSAYIHAVATGEVRHILDNTSSIRSLAFSPDGTLFVTGGFSLAVWDVVSGALQTTLQPANSEFAHGFSADAAHAWLPCPESFHNLSLAFNPDGTQLAAADAAGRVTLWAMPSGEPVATLSGYNFGGEARGGASSDTISRSHFAFSPDGATLAAGASGYITSGGWVELWDLEHAVVRDYLPGSGSVSAVAYSPDGTQLVTASALSGLRLWDVTTGTVRDVLLEYGDAVGSVAFSPDGTRVAAGLTYGEIHLWDTTTGNPLAVLEGHTDYMTSITFSPDTALIAAGDADGTIQLWDVARGALVTTLEGHVGRVNDVVFMPHLLPDGGRVLVSAGGFDDGTVRFWSIPRDSSSAEQLAVLASVPEPVMSVASTPDGTLLASGHGDGAVRLWDARTGDLLATLTGHARDLAVNVVFSADGTLLATGGGDGTIHLWGVPH